jgi:predicted tellurium resistance membrane protein TerC
MDISVLLISVPGNYFSAKIKTTKFRLPSSTMTELFTSEALVSLVALTFMEIVLGIDNIVFISIVTGKLPKEQQPRARNLGLILALGFRIALLLGITWIIGLKEPVFTLPIPIGGVTLEPSWRDMILFAGGLFLLSKSVSEMHGKLEGEEGEGQGPKKANGFARVIFQIIMLDVIFSFDSILTAVGLVEPDMVLIMIIAVTISLVVMLLAAGKISAFINEHPTMKMLALAFLLLIGFMLAFEGLHSLHHQEIPKGYIYFAMAFSFGVELLNMRVRKNAEGKQIEKG